MLTLLHHAQGRPREVRTAWHAKEVVRSIYDIDDPDVAREFVEQLADDQQHDSCPPEVHSLGRMLRRWLKQIVAWHEARVTNGPTEATNNLIKRIKRVGFGLRRLRHYHVRTALRRPAKLGATPDRHTPLTSDEPDNEAQSALGRRIHKRSGTQPPDEGRRATQAVTPTGNSAPGR